MSKILYKLVKNNNSKSAAYGKWYARAVSKETLTFREFIEHVISHGSVYDRGTVTGILTQMLDCLKELMLDSKKVKFGEFGTFYASIRSKGAEELDKFNVGEHITGVCMRFLPARSEGNDSISLRRAAQFKSTAEMANAEELNAANTPQGGGSGE